jgi:hypothetical protein
MATSGVIPKAANFIPVMGGVSSASDAGNTARPYQYHPTTRGMTVHPVSGLALNAYDYVSMALSAADTTETYTFKTGGAGGATVNTVVIVYTDNTRTVLVSVTKT